MVLTIWKILFANIMAEPAVFIGLIVLVGYALLRRPWYDCFSGFIKAKLFFGIVQCVNFVITNADSFFNHNIT